MNGIIIGSMLVGFFAGGNIVIVAKDMKFKGKADTINSLGAVCGCLAMIIITVLTTAGVFKY